MTASISASQPTTIAPTERSVSVYEDVDVQKVSISSYISLLILEPPPLFELHLVQVILQD
jgi:hypothetical protein